MVLMGWGGSEGFAPVVGIFFFTGPLLLTFAMVFEWIMGNFFPSEFFYLCLTRAEFVCPAFTMTMYSLF